ncbi:MAG: AAA family ATPase [Rhodanobacteraceae bacterium]
MNTTPTDIGSHLKVLGLGRIPFPTTPDASCYFHTRDLQEEMGETVHCVMARKGFVLITGEIGLGKSTFVRRLTDTVLEKNCVVSFVLNTFLEGAELLRAINLDFGLEPGASFADDVARLNAFLVKQHNEGRTALIIVDDAQNLCLESLELMRMLSNFETSQEKLVQILLCGQPELVDKLSDPSIRQLASRIVKHVELRPLSLEETRNYVGFRLNSAGSEGRITMAPDALRLLCRISAGNPRRMHMILDRCLYGLVAMRTSAIKPVLIRRAAAESGIREPRPRLRRNSTRLAIAAAVACLATVVAASVLTRHSNQTDAAVAVADGGKPATHQSVGASVPVPSDTAPTAMPAEAANATCLQQFGLDDRKGSIGSALQAADLAAVRAAIKLQKPGLAVISVPPSLALDTSSPSACELSRRAPRVLLWQPAAPMDAFAFGARGPEVLQLQQRLARSGDYQYQLDGLAGPRTAKAIADFQRQHGLAASGYPDELTQFALEHAGSPAGSRPH